MNNSNDRAFILLWLAASCGSLAAQSMTIRDLYGGNGRGRDAFANFKMVREDEDPGDDDVRPVTEYGKVQFAAPFSPDKKITWKLEPTIPRDFVIWPAWKNKGLTDPCMDFKLQILSSDVGVQARKDMVKNLLAGDFERANEIFKQLSFVYRESDQLSSQIGFNWMLAFHIHLTTVIDMAFRGDRTTTQGPLSPGSPLSQDERIKGGKVVSGWLRQHQNWMDSPRLTDREKALIAGEMMARCESYATHTYLKRILPPSGSWPDRTFDQMKADLSPGAQELFGDDVSLLYDCITQDSTKAVLDRLVTEYSGSPPQVKEQWAALLSNKAVDGIVLFNENDEQVLKNMRMAALEKIVDIVNTSVARMK